MWTRMIVPNWSGGSARSGPYTYCAGSLIGTALCTVVYVLQCSVCMQKASYRTHTLYEHCATLIGIVLCISKVFESVAITPS